MRKRYGALFRFIVEQCVQPTECVRAEHIVDAEEQAIDVYIDRDGDGRDPDPRLGLLGQITAQRVILEAFHSPPNSESIGECVMKQRALHAKRRRDERSAAGQQDRAMRDLEVPLLWLLSAGDPETARREMAFAPMQNAPSGMYTLPVGWRTRLVVIAQLPVNQQSLLLRLMGDGETRKFAVKQLATEYAHGWEAALLFSRLQRLRLTIEQNPTHSTDEAHQDLEALMDVFELAEQYRTELKREARVEGRAEGRAEGAVKTARTALLLVIGSRKITLTPEEQARIDACSDEAALQDWLQNAANATTAAEVFAAREAPQG
jgi:hypothetical protein